MGLFILSETSAGYALIKARDSKLLKNESLAKEAETADGINEMLKLKSFVKFDSAAVALAEVAELTEGKVTPMLAKLLESIKDEKKASLAVADPKLATAINKIPGLTLQPISDSTTNDLFRAIREHLPSLIPGLLPENIATMSLGLSHSLSRHKLKFSPDKVDTMIVQAIALLDDLDKELNTYAMRVKEWYGWHFPEMARIINDNLALSRVILKMGMRTSAASTDLSEILPEEIETALKAAAEVSMGTEITEQDLENIKLLAEQVVGFTEYRQQLSSYLTSRMQAIAPNLTELVGELVGARLIAHAGSLMSLAKSPGSTIQILGAEKALFRALKTKHDTPKYGLIYHASLVGQATGKNKGKIARMLASKAAIGIRVDALSSWSAEGEGKGDDVDEETRASLGVISRAKIERQLRALEGKPLLPRSVAVGPNGKPATVGKWDISEAKKYNADADGLTGDAPAADAPEPTQSTPSSSKKEKKEKKSKKEKKTKVVATPDSDADEMDVDSGLALPAPDLTGTAALPVAQTNGSHPEVDEKAAKKAKKAAEKLAKKAAKESVEVTQKSNEELAKLAGLSLSKFEKKLAKGEVTFDAEGNPVTQSSKKDKKDAAAEEPKKRKRSDEDGEKGEEKKKKKKSKD